MEEVRRSNAAGKVRADMKNKRIAINEEMNWGGLEDTDRHDASFGARFADNRSRDFGIFGNRMTLIGDERIAHKLERLILGNKVIRDIKKNTSFSYYGGDKPPYDDANNWSTRYSIGKDIDVTLEVTCRGEYVYVRAYADIARPLTIDVENKDGLIDDAWIPVVNGREVETEIHAVSKTEALRIVEEFISNELEARRDLWPV